MHTKYEDGYFPEGNRSEFKTNRIKGSQNHLAMVIRGRRGRSGTVPGGAILDTTPGYLIIPVHHGPGGPTSVSGNKQALSTGLDPGVL